MDISQLGASGAVVIVVLVFLKYMREDGLRRDKTYKQVVSALNKNANAVAKADKYLRDRNGRDAEYYKETVKSITAIPEKMQAIADTQAQTLLENLKKLPTQNIEHQHVKDQTIENTK